MARLPGGNRPDLLLVVIFGLGLMFFSWLLPMIAVDAGEISKELGAGITIVFSTLGAIIVVAANIVSVARENQQRVYHLDDLFPDEQQDYY